MDELKLQEKTTYVNKMELPVLVDFITPNGLFTVKNSSDRYFSNGNYAGRSIAADKKLWSVQRRQHIQHVECVVMQPEIDNSSLDLIREDK